MSFFPFADASEPSGSPLLDIVRACELIGEFTRGSDEDMFLNDLRTQSAVLHQLLVLGEAVKRLSAEYREAHDRVPWESMAGMRDRIIHGYDIVDLHEVWRTAERDVPELLDYLKPPTPGADEPSDTE